MQGFKVYLGSTIREKGYSLLSIQKWGEGFASDVTNQLESSGALEAQTMCEQGKGPISNLLLTFRIILVFHCADIVLNKVYPSSEIKDYCGIFS